MATRYEKPFVREEVCAECGGQIGFDALADWHGELITTYDHYTCMDCGVNEPKLMEVTDEN